MSGAIKAARAGYSGDPNYRRSMPGTGYAGDPGLFGFLGKVARGALGIATEFVPGPAGAIARRGFRSVFGQKKPSRVQRQLAQQFPATPAVARPGPMRKQRLATAAGRPRGIRGIKRDETSYAIEYQPGGRRAPGEVIEAGPGGACPAGYKPNKTGYWVTSPLGTPSYVEPGERCVKARRRNPLNPRAWDRAYSRLKSAKRWQKKMAGVVFRETC